jgi:hypothetical protein
MQKARNKRSKMNCKKITKSIAYPLTSSEEYQHYDSHKTAKTTQDNRDTPSTIH